MKIDRVAWVDIARAFGIIAVIYGHTLTWDSHRYLLYAFHIPLFFFISGFVHHYKKSQHFKNVLIKSIKNNLIPYFIFALLTFFVVLLSQGFKGLTLYNFGYQVLGILYGSGNMHFLSFNVALWFLPCLFITKLAFFLLEKISNSKKFLTLSLITFSIAGYISSIYFTEVKLPFGLEIALTGIVFFGFGYLSGQRRERITILTKKYWLIILPVAILTCIYTATLNYDMYGYQIDLRLNKLANYFYFYLAAASGIIACITASMLINRNRVLEYIGQNSLILYVWQWIALSNISRITKEVIIPTNNIQNIYLAPIYTTLATGIILFINNIYQKLKPIKNSS